MRGKNFLKVTGVLMIIGAGINFMSMLSASKLLVNINTSYYIMSTIMGIAELVAGIIGIAWCKKPEKAKLCLVVGIVLLVLIIINTILQISTYGVGTGLLGIIFGSVLPVLYIIGAVLNSKDKG